MEYAKLEKPSGSQKCSHESCSCNGVLIPQNAGYLHIEQKLIDCIRQDKACLSNAKAENDSDKISTIGPILVCEQGARSRNIDLKVAAAEAEYWWKTGRVPMRATPIAGTGEAKAEQKRIDLLEQLTQLRAQIKEIDNPTNKNFFNTHCDSKGFSFGFGNLTASMLLAAFLDSMVEYENGKEPSADEKQKRLKVASSRINQLAQQIGQNDERVLTLRKMHSIVEKLTNKTSFSNEAHKKCFVATRETAKKWRQFFVLTMGRAISKKPLCFRER